MSRQRGTASYADFVRLADRHVSVHLRRLGYRRAGLLVRDQAGALRPDTEGPAPATGGPLARVRRVLLDRADAAPLPAGWAIGYEALSEAAAETVAPGDPGSAREARVELSPSTGELSMLLGTTLEALLTAYAVPGAAAVVTDAARPLGERMERLDAMLGELVAARFRP